jgi:glycosyltransferase involved in cell wall biosynthesis
MRIACMGTRGIPARYGGFETFIENLAPRLAARGHDVTVYNRVWSSGHGRHFGSVHLIPLPSIHTKHLDTITHTALSVLHGITRGYDAVLICGPGSAPLAWVPRLAGASVVVNVDGADSKRAKWGPVAKAYLRTAERGAAVTANAVVADNRAVQGRFKDEYGVDALFIPYGATIRRATSDDALRQFDLVPRRYILWVGRLEPETRVEELIHAFGRLEQPDIRLAIVGDAPFAGDYRRSLQEIADSRVVFTGYAFGDAYGELSSHALAYVQTSPTSGTSPAMLDQMGFGNAIVARGTATNREVVDDAGLLYDQDDPIDGLAQQLRRLIDDPALADRLRTAAVDRVRSSYDWEHVTDEYEDLFKSLRRRSGRSA